MIGVLGGSGNFAYKNVRIDNVGYDAYSTDWPQVDASDISPGRNFTRTEYEAGQPVVLLNDTLKTQLFGTSEPIGKQIMISGRQFTGQAKQPSMPGRNGSMFSASSLSVQVVSWLFFVPIAPSMREGR